MATFAFPLKSMGCISQTASHINSTQIVFEKLRERERSQKNMPTKIVQQIARKSKETAILYARAAKPICLFCCQTADTVHVAELPSVDENQPGHVEPLRVPLPSVIWLTKCTVVKFGLCLWMERERVVCYLIEQWINWPNLHDRICFFDASRCVTIVSRWISKWFCIYKLKVTHTRTPIENVVARHWHRPDSFISSSRSSGTPCHPGLTERNWDEQNRTRNLSARSVLAWVRSGIDSVRCYLHPWFGIFV